MLDSQEKEEVGVIVDEKLEFSQRKVGDTPTDANQLVPKQYCDTNIIPVSSLFGAKGDLLVGTATSVFGRFPVGTDGYVLTAASSSVFGVAWNPIPTPVLPNGLFGDGSDGVGTANGVGNLAGLSPSGNVYTLTRDVYFTSLTISTGVTINPAGYQIFVQGTTTINGTGKIARNGFNGSNGTNGANTGSQRLGGGGGSVLGAGTLPGSLGGIDGGFGAGAVSGTTNGGAGGNGSGGTSTNPSIGVASQVGSTSSGAGGNAGAQTGGSPGSGGAAGTATLALNNPHTLNGAYLHADFLASYTRHQGSATNGGSGGGGSGAADGADSGDGGGAGGGGGVGGIIALYSNTIVNNASPGLEAKGGNGGTGGNGGNGAGANAGGGQGGAGGRGGVGGVIIVVYESLTQSGTFNAAGGTGGNGGTGGTGGGAGGIGADGATAGDGVSGLIWQYQVV